MTSNQITPLEELRKRLKEFSAQEAYWRLGYDSEHEPAVKSIIEGARGEYNDLKPLIDEALLEIEKRDAALTEANKEILGLRAIGLDPEIYNKRDNEIERLQSQVDVLSYRAPTESAKLIKELEEKWFVFKEEMNQRNEAVLKYSESQSKLIDEARKVIEFYGNKKNWDERWVEFGGDEGRDGDVSDVISQDDVDWEEDESGPYLTVGGKRARAFLAKLDGGK